MLTPFHRNDKLRFFATIYHISMKTLFLLPLLTIQAFAQQTISYKVFYSPEMAKEGLKVEVHFTPDKPSDSTYFHYSNEVWGEKNIMNSLSGFEGATKKYRFRMDKDSNRIVVTHPGAKDLRFSYRIKQDHADSPMVFSRPRVQNEFFHILGESLFTVPESVFVNLKDDPKTNVTIEWIGFPESYTLHNMFASQQRRQVLTVKLWSTFYHSLFVGGDYRLHHFIHHSKDVYFAIRGNWYNYTDQKLVEELKKTLITQREFWNDDRFDYYTVIMTPTVTLQDSSYRGQSMNGSGIHNGFMIQSSNNTFNSWSVMNYIFNHEMMHDWIGGKIRMEHEELNYWFSEGFTDYYTFKNRLRNGSLSASEWLVEFNTEIIKAHYDNPERNQPNYRIKDDFWNSRNIEKIPYRRGALFAFWLDQQILLKSDGNLSLDDFMRELLLQCEQEDVRFTDELFLELVKKYLEQDISYFFQKHILTGVDIDWAHVDLIDGFEITQTEGFPQLLFSGETETVVRFYLHKTE